MSQTSEEDRYLEDALKRQKELVDFYKKAAKEAPEGRCKDIFKHLRSGIKDQMGDVARELARHRMERGRGHPLDQS